VDNRSIEIVATLIKTALVTAFTLGLFVGIIIFIDMVERWIK
jgi:hypothetical protein